MCPVCEHTSRWPAKLRQHIERKHPDELRTLGKEKLSNILYWRSKANVRRISYERVNRFVRSSLEGSENISASKLFDVIKSAFKLVLVKIADDQEICGYMANY